MNFKGVLIFIFINISKDVIADSNVCVGQVDGTLLPHDEKCEMFYLCNAGRALEMKCPDDLYFNPKTLQCDYKNLVECKTAEESIECPSGQEFVFIASKIRCDWYYLCIQGIPNKLECAEGYHFNAKENRCDSPENANCLIESTTSQPTTTTTPSSTAPPQTSTNPTTVAPTTSSPPINFDKYCKPDVLHSLPHPYKCNSFLLCYNGSAVERFCGENLHFSPKHNDCRKPREAQCISDGTLCPNINDVNDIIVVENVYDCNSFYMCFNGSPVPLQCGPGQHWNQERETCVLKESSKCQALEFPFPDLNIKTATCSSNETYLIPHPTHLTTLILCDKGMPTIINFTKDEK